MNEKHLTPLKAIRAKCLDCCNGSSKEVKLCTVAGCPLYPLRLGKNPRRAGIGGNGRFGAENSGSINDLPPNQRQEE